nr:hypothetical protein [Tanacetum cinerariifolium]
EVIVNGDALASIASVSGSAEIAIPPKTTAEKIARRNEIKEKITLLLAIPDEHLLKFHGIKDAKTLWEEIKTSLNEAVNTAQNVYAASSQGQASTSTYVDDVMFSFFATQSNSPQLDNEDLEQIDTDDLEEMDLKWQRGHFAKECRAPKSQGNINRYNIRKVVPVETPANALVVTNAIDYDWIYQAEEGPTDFALMAFSSLSSSSSDTETGLGYDSKLNEKYLSNKSDVFESAYDSSVNESEEDNNQANDRYKTCEGYHAVPPPYTGNSMPPKPDLSFAGLDDYVFTFAIRETITSVNETKTSTSKTSKESMEKPKTVRPSAPIIEDWESDSDDDCESRLSIE